MDSKSNPEEVLTARGLKAVRTYMLTLVALPGVVIAIISFFLGYLIKDVATSKAYYEISTELRDNSSALYQDMLNDVLEFKEISVKEQTNALNALQALKNVEDQAKQYEISLKALKSIDNVKNITTDITRSLQSDKRFITELTKGLSDGLPKGLNKECRSIKRPTSCSKSWDLSCKNNEYVKSVSNVGGSNSCISKITCCQLRF